MRPVDGLAIEFIVECNCAQLGEIVQRVRRSSVRTQRLSGTTDAPTWNGIRGTRSDGHPAVREYIEQDAFD